MNELTPLSEFRVLSMTPVVNRLGDKTDSLAVAFRAGQLPFNFVVNVSKSHFLDEDIVRIAQHYFHVESEHLALSTSKWRLSEEEFAQIAERGKESPKKGPETVPL